MKICSLKKSWNHPITKINLKHTCNNSRALSRAHFTNIVWLRFRHGLAITSIFCRGAITLSCPYFGWIGEWVSNYIPHLYVDVITHHDDVMETFSALLAICAGNSPLTGEFPAQRPVTRNFDVSLICVRKNCKVNNHEAGDLRRHHTHYGVIVMTQALISMPAYFYFISVRKWGPKSQMAGRWIASYRIMDTKLHLTCRKILSIDIQWSQ